MNNKLRVLMILCDYQGCGWYRMLMPAHYLNSTGEVHAVCTSEIMMADMFNYDIVIFQRHFEEKINPLFKAAKDSGATVIYEMDDDFFNIRPKNPAFALVKPKDKENVKYLMRNADAIFVSTDPLVHMYKSFNKNIHVLPNMIEIDDSFLSMRPYDMEKSIRMVYCGGPSHIEDFEEMESAFGVLLDKYPGLLEVVFIGYCPEYLKSDKRVLYIPWLNISDFMRALSSQLPHIGLVPLAKNSFNAAKSNIKFLEYTAVGAVTVASAVRPYMQTIDHGVNGMIVDNNKAETWVSVVSELIDAPGRLEAMRKAALVTIKDRGLNIKGNSRYWLGKLLETHSKVQAKKRNNIV
jgi:glycosyltransferase involved in cell wall biosynthesis